MSLFVTPAKLLLIIDDVITFLNIGLLLFFAGSILLRENCNSPGSLFACAVNRGKLSVSIQQYLRPYVS